MIRVSEGSVNEGDLQTLVGVHWSRR